MSKVNGGPAFPHHWDELLEGQKDIDWNNCYRATRLQEGMSLRDYFAAKAMMGLIGFYASKDQSESVIADLAYLQADAMLKQREVVA